MVNMRRMMSLAISLCAMGWWMLAQSPPARAREVTLEPHRGTGAVCAVVAVPAGSAYETSMTRGVSHLIEHMVFDGAERYSRVEMSTWMDDVGGFLNAFTRT
jgi:predicted Zn-dependent peptidase